MSMKYYDTVFLSMDPLEQSKVISLGVFIFGYNFTVSSE